MFDILSNLLIITIAVYLLGIITDEYFIISLDEISHRLQLPPNVAGASLMAMGSSAPELAIALLSLFQKGGAHSDVGVGTIVGSAVFNILVITSISAIARPARITWNAVVRDVVVYVASIGALLVIFGDGEVSLYEALALLGMYTIYIVILFNWKKGLQDDEIDVIELVEEELAAEHVRPGLFRRLSLLVTRGLGLLTGDAKRQFLRGFLVSILLISVISWFLVDAVVSLASAVGVPPVIVAITVLAGGTSVPDLLASVAVARQGRGDMAVANAVGSNVFDILIGLGLPWIIIILVQGGVVTVGIDDLWNATVALLGTVVLLFAFLTTGRVLTRREGWILLIVYVAFVLWMWLG